MATTIKEELLRWIILIIERKISLQASARVCPYGKRTVERWIAAYKCGSERALEPRSTRPKTSSKEIPIGIKEEIIALRKKKKVCALKLHWKFQKQGLTIHPRTIGKILKAEGLVKKYRTKKVTYKYLKVALKPGELVKIDVKHVPGHVAGKHYFQYTAIDCASQWRYLRIFDVESTAHTLLFLQDVMRRFPHRITGVKTDNHSTFTNYYLGTNRRTCMTMKTPHALGVFCGQHLITHYLIDPGKPAQNGKVERSHRSDQETLYDCASFTSVKDLRTKVRRWNIVYSDLEHCELNGKTPNEML